MSDPSSWNCFGGALLFVYECPSLSTLAKVCLTLPVGTASVECFFLFMKVIKTRVRNGLGEINLSHPMKIAIESPLTLSEEEFEHIVDVWNRKSRKSTAV